MAPGTHHPRAGCQPTSSQSHSAHPASCTWISGGFTETTSKPQDLGSRTRVALWFSHETNHTPQSRVKARVVIPLSSVCKNVLSFHKGWWEQRGMLQARRQSGDGKVNSGVTLSKNYTGYTSETQLTQLPWQKCWWQKIHTQFLWFPRTHNISLCVDV